MISGKKITIEEGFSSQITNKRLDASFARKEEFEVGF